MTDALAHAKRRSAIEDAEHCLYRYNAIWNHGTPDQSDYSLRGIGYHAVKYRYVARLWNQKLPSDAEEARTAFVEGIADAKTPPHLVPEILGLFERQARWFQLDLDRYLLAETRQTSEDGTWAPDLVYAGDDELEIVDDKTYYAGMTEAQLRTLFQARFYIRKAMDRFKGFQKYRFTMNWVRLGYQTSVVFDIEDVATLNQEVQAVFATIEAAAANGDWPASAGPQCGYCTLRCPLVEAAANMPISVQTAGQAAALAGALYVSETRNALVKKTLKRWAIANGNVPIAVKGLVYQHLPVDTVKYPADKVIEVLQARQVLPTFTLSRSTLKKLFKIHPSLEMDLKMYEERSTKWQFSAKKLVETEAPCSSDDDDEEDQ